MSRKECTAMACDPDTVSARRWRRRLASLLAAPARGMRRLWGDVGGVAAVEFGLIAPVLIVMLLGIIEITRAVSVDRRFTLVTSMVADLVARESRLTADDVKAIYDIAAVVMAPYDATKLKLSLVPVARDDKKTFVYPSLTNRPSYNGGPNPSKCQTYALADGLIAKQETVIVVEGSYTYTPLLAGSLVGTLTWQDKAYAKPRKVGCVAFDGENCSVADSSCFNS